MAISNKDRILKSANEMMSSFLRSPKGNFYCLRQAVDELKPLLEQFFLSGYIFAFQLPRAMIKFLATVGDSAFPSLIHSSEYRIDRADFNPHHSMAVSVGPGEAECRTATDEANPLTYGPSVLTRAREAGSWFVHFTAYYRDGVIFDEWQKSFGASGIDTGTEDSSMVSGHQDHQPSSAPSNAIGGSRTASLRVPATILWGERDRFCGKEICLDGIDQYLIKGSQVVMLPDTAHWTPLERNSRHLLQGVLEAVTQKEDIDRNELEALIHESYPSARVSLVK